MVGGVMHEKILRQRYLRFAHRILELSQSISKLMIMGWGFKRCDEPIPVEIRDKFQRSYADLLCHLEAFEQVIRKIGDEFNLHDKY